ncbi:MAG: bifunctional heptose 7-phosphate kinase/heptose 1-phosphate adenyltransferase [Planctomycetota bacterium]
MSPARGASDGTIEGGAFDAFGELRALVLGDLILDRYVEAKPNRISREAPVLVFSEGDETLLPGGAANVARNLRSLGIHTRILGCVGADRDGRDLIHALEAAGLDVNGVRPLPGHVTPRKTRIVAGEDHRTPQQVLRLDREPEQGPPQWWLEALGEELEAAAGSVDLVLLSDYHYGSLGPALDPALATLRRHGARVIFDPREALGLLREVDALTPNLDDFARSQGLALAEIAEPEQLERAAHRAAATLGVENLVVTLGRGGMLLVRPQGTAFRVAAAGAAAAVDVTGAGDTAAALFGAGLSAGLAPQAALQLANAAAGVAVSRSGPAVLERAELATAFAQSPAPTPLWRGSGGPRSAPDVAPDERADREAGR